MSTTAGRLIPTILDSGRSLFRRRLLISYDFRQTISNRHIIRFREERVHFKNSFLRRVATLDSSIAADNNDINNNDNNNNNKTNAMNVTQIESGDF